MIYSKMHPHDVPPPHTSFRFSSKVPTYTLEQPTHAHHGSSSTAHTDRAQGRWRGGIWQGERSPENIYIHRRRGYSLKMVALLACAVRRAGWDDWCWLISRWSLRVDRRWWLHWQTYPTYTNTPSLSGGIFVTIFSSVELIICAGPICASSLMLFYSYTNDLFPFHSK